MKRWIYHASLLVSIVALLVSCGGRGDAATTAVEPAATGAIAASTATPAATTTARTSIVTRTATTPSGTPGRQSSVTPGGTGGGRLSLTINDARIDMSNTSASGLMIFVRVRNELSSMVTVRIADFRVRDSAGYVYRPNEQWSSTATTANGGKEPRNGETSLDGREVTVVVLWVPEAHRASSLQLTYLPEPNLVVPFTPRGGTP